MVMKVTRWSPDTCECVIDYAWDDAQDENTRVHTVKEIIRDCGRHGVSTMLTAGKYRGALYDTVLAENQLKNRVLPILQEDQADLDGDSYRWRFDDNRVLHVTNTKDPSRSKKKQHQDKLDKKFGKNKVVVD